MTSPPRLPQAMVAFLVPDGELGEAILGDLAEAHQAVHRAHGAARADAAYAIESVRSIPGLVVRSLREWGWRRLALRTFPALVAGYVALAALVILSSLLLEVVGLGGYVASLVSGFGCGVGGGWVIARLAGGAPRQHGVLLGAAAMTVGLAMYAADPAVAPAWYWFTLQVIVLPAAWLGGYLHWSGRRRPRLG